jgi:endonuclease YncB( thermonuclease family)
MAIPTLYHYLAEVTSVYDGDTFDCIVDMGFSTSVKIKVRVLGIDTCEMKSKDPELKAKAVQARDYLRSVILGKKIILRTAGMEKYGRWLGEIWEVPAEGADLGESINSKMISLGHAKAYFGGTKE